NNDSAHDWWHIFRVWNLAKNIGKNENVDMFVVELGALLHDIADYKFYDGDEMIGPRKVKEILTSLGVNEKIIVHVQNILKNISYSSNIDKKREFNSRELEVIQDADMLDGMGAIGIARTFVYGGNKAREMYNPDIKPKLNMNKDEYRKDTGPTINHFYEKLLLLKDKMNTTTGKEIAENRHKYMEGFLEEFYLEWDGVC
ncbi:MAG: HD domain-containing protein, partial [Candidatus Gracilibacteria bacterium]|nr:HD domain-containing protein [Candidatus Gracilibacteria bacterium]